MRLKQLLLIIKVYIVKLLSLFESEHDYWVIAERGHEARDNGYAFYKYMKNEHPEIRVYYLITKNSTDIDRISKDDVLFFGSYQHYYRCVNCQAIISTHTYLFFEHCFYRLYKLLMLKPIIVFLQHGIIKDLMPFYFKSNNYVDLFITAANKEYNYILDNYGYTSENVKCTGLARYDNLKNDVSEKTILIMPTWRQYYSKYDDFEFTNTAYYIGWSKILKRIDNEFANGIKVVFYQHYEFQKYNKLFYGMKNVIVGDMEKYDVQGLLSKSSVLITDYSSVYFDFAYLRKPVIYYQFDEKEYREKHYQQGYFDYRSDGFGPVVVDDDSLMNELWKVINKDFSIDRYYCERIEGFYRYHDTKNCERIYQEIVEKCKGYK